MVTINHKSLELHNVMVKTSIVIFLFCAKQVTHIKQEVADKTAWQKQKQYSSVVQQKCKIF